MNDGLVALDIVLTPIEDIRPTEEVSQARVEALLTEISATGFWTRPLFIEAQTQAIMDGHHRYHAAVKLGLKVLPTIAFHYDDQRVRLESWRPKDQFTPDMVKHAAVSGKLLPQKSTRHVFLCSTPRSMVPLADLGSRDQIGLSVASAPPHATRSALLGPYYHLLGYRLGVQTIAGSDAEVDSAEVHVPHPLLRRSLQNDPSMAALLPAAKGRIAAGRQEDAPFYVKASGLLRLPPALFSHPAALAAAARWGLEAAFFQASGLNGDACLTAILHHGAHLLQSLSVVDRDLFLDQLPPKIGAELMSLRKQSASAVLLAWQATRIEGFVAGENGDTAGRMQALLLGHELTTPVERILITGGDSRLGVDRASGLNRYGVAPRPRPEAIHFSSSTASSVSDYGFMFADRLRRDLLSTALKENLDPDALRSRLVDVVGSELLGLLSLTPDDADVCITPSGTDTELIAVMLALAADERPLTNILISPEETGRGVAFAGAGAYFDDIAATGATIRKGAVAWPARDLEVVEIAIRSPDGSARPVQDIDIEMAAITRSALDRGRRVLLHVLRASKTGLSAPSLAAVRELAQIGGDAVDVVVDACQMRSPLAELAECARQGWMIQISGSKFFTGPPFSGALISPVHLRRRAAMALPLVQQAPGVLRVRDWTVWWRERLAPARLDRPASFGPLFRWLPALMEARLLNAVPLSLRWYALNRFEDAIQDRLRQSTSLKRAVLPSADPGEVEDNDLTRRTIACFSVMVDSWDGHQLTLDAAGCQRIFQLLNMDVTGRLGRLGPADQVLAAQKIHIGQPVTLCGENADSAFTILRLVLGARFFTIIGHAGPGAIEAALESEIADAIRAIEKLELIARHWWTLDESEPG